MPKHPPLWGECFIKLENGETVPVNSLSPEKWAECRKKMMENVGRVMSDYVYGTNSKT